MAENEIKDDANYKNDDSRSPCVEKSHRPA